MYAMKKPLFWLGLSFAILGGLVFGGALSTMISTDNFDQVAGLSVPLIFVAAGIGLIIVSRRAGDGPKFEPGHFVFWIFGGFGVVAVTAGIAMAFEDPAALFLVVFGGVFIGVAFVARKVFVTPEGMKRVSVSKSVVATRGPYGQTGSLSEERFIHVPEDANPEEVEARVRKWRAREVEEKMEERPDWRTGRIEQDAKLMGGVLKYVALAAAAGTIIFYLIGTYADSFFLLFALMAGVISAVVFVMAFRQGARARKFGYAVFAMRDHPVAPGDPLEGYIETEAPRRSLKDGAFRVTLACLRTTRHKRGDKTEYRTTTLWSEEQEIRATGEQALKLRIRFRIPEDQPAASLGRNLSVRHSWELKAEAEAPGVDFLAKFDLPVLQPE